jgi:tetratricopeptide (TPR) repeat protein
MAEEARGRLSTDPDDAPARLQLLTAWFQLGRLDEAAQEAERLAAQFTRTGARAAGEALLAGQLTLKRRQAAIAAAKDLVARHPDSFPGWLALAEEGLQDGDRALAKSAADRALALTPRNQSTMRARLLRFRADLVRADDPIAATRGLLEAYLEDGDARFAVESLKLGHVRLSETQFAAAAAAVTREPAVRERLQVLWLQATGRETGILEDLRHNLRAMVARARDAGAEVVLVGYPFARPDVEAAQREVARDSGVEFVPTWPVFAEALATRPRSELYIPDGHCSSGGYALMARTLLPLVRKRVQ